jgi:hypothetical protein
MIERRAITHVSLNYSGFGLCRLVQASLMRRFPCVGMYNKYCMNCYILCRREYIASAAAQLSFGIRMLSLRQALVLLGRSISDILAPVAYVLTTNL